MGLMGRNKKKREERQAGAGSIYGGAGANAPHPDMKN
jgi:hypothetical protein